MSEPMLRRSKADYAVPHARGFTLIELMVAITLGILISLGLVMLFQATAKTNRVQDAMAQLQETGRYAVSRINHDLRMTAFQSLNVSGFVDAAPSASATPNGVDNPSIAAISYVAAIKLPDFDSAGLVAPSTATGWAANWPAATPWPVSQRYFIQGYECSSGTCSPALPTGTNALPAVGTTAGSRVKTADVLTVRYLDPQAVGWSLSKNELSETTSATGGTSCNGDSLSSITVTPATGGEALNFASGDLAMVVTGSRAEIFPVDVSGSTLTPTAGSIIGGSVPCFPLGPSDVTLHNFSQDFLTVTYYLKLDTDPNDASRLIPVLVRRQSNIDNQGTASNDQELVQGVEQMDFLLGAQRTNGTISYLTGDEVDGQSSSTTCSPTVSSQYDTGLPAGTVEPQCLWRSLSSIETHLLVDSVNNIYTLTPQDMAYQYTYGYDGTDKKQTPAAPPSAGTALTSGLKAGNMLRREFVSLVSIRNYNP
jgi:type IV pilus assembly protein PilW